MRSATATPSSSALCASIGPRTTSPIAQTFGRLVRHSSSTATKPRSSSLQPDGLGVEPVGIRHAPDRDDQLVERRALRLARGVGIFDRHALLRRHFGDLHAELDREALLREDFRRFLRHLLVGGAEERRQRFEDRHFRAEPAPHAAHLEADHAGADHAEPLRHFGNRERAVVVEDQSLLSKSAPGSARGFDPVATMTCFALSVSSVLPATLIW